MVVRRIIDMQLLPRGAGTGGNAVTAQANRTPQNSGRYPVGAVLTATAAAAVGVGMLVTAGVVAVGRLLLVLLLMVPANVWA